MGLTKADRNCAGIFPDSTDFWKRRERTGATSHLSCLMRIGGMPSGPGAALAGRESIAIETSSGEMLKLESFDLESSSGDLKNSSGDSNMWSLSGVVKTFLYWLLRISASDMFELSLFLLNGPTLADFFVSFFY